MIRNEDGYTEEFIKLRIRFKECFKQYPDVLNHLLTDMGTFQNIPTDAGAVALRNYGVRILEILGAYDESLIQDVLQGFLSLPLTYNPKPQEEEF